MIIVLQWLRYHRVMNYIEAPIALPLSLDNEAMMPPRRKKLISLLFQSSIELVIHSHLILHRSCSLFCFCY